MIRLIAGPGGAGTFPSAVEKAVKAGLIMACQSGFSAATVNQAVETSIMILEDDDNFNAGYGSNLTEDGTVECDASMMSGDGEFGSVGATKGVKNPIHLASCLLDRRREAAREQSDRVAPLTLVGEGALRFAQKEQRSKQSCPALTVSPDTMISKRASSEHAYWFEKYLKGDTTIPDNRTVAITQDTVGAVACTVDGQFGAGVSSGGILLKYPGRIGEAAIFGAGCWARNASGDGAHGFACSVSGTGEEIIRQSLSRAISEQIESEDIDIHEVLIRVLSPFRESPTLEAGILLLTCEVAVSGPLQPRLWCAFTTQAMAVAYLAAGMNRTKAFVLRNNVASSKKTICVQSLPI